MADYKTFSPQKVKDEDKHPARNPNLPQSTRIVVVGAGIMGSMTALFLQKEGYHVTLLEAIEPGNEQSGSGGETRLIRSIYGGNLTYPSITDRAWDLWHKLQEEINQQIIFQTGVLWWYNNKYQPFIEDAVKVLNQLNIPYKLMDPAQLQIEFPGINTSDLEGGLLEQRAGYLLASRACKVVVEKFISKGGDYFQEKVTHKSATRFGDFIIYACGGWMKKLFPEIFNQTLTVTRQDVLFFETPSGWHSRKLPGWVDLTSDDIFYGIPFNLKHGFKVAHDKRGVVINPESEDHKKGIPNQTETRHFLEKRFTELKQAKLIRYRVCQYANTKSGNLFIDFHPTQDNVLLMGGGSGHSFKYGPALGEMVASFLKGQTLLPAAFALPMD